MKKLKFLWKKLKYKTKNLDSFQKQNARLISIGCTVTLLLVFASTLLGVAVTKETKALVLGIWSEYIDNDIIKRFSEKYDVPVQIVNYDSNEALSQKLNGTIIDLFVPSDYYLTYLIEQNYVEEIDFGKINLNKETDYIEEIKKRVETSEDNKEILNYGIPYFWGYNSLTFSNESEYERVKNIVGEEEIKDMSFFFDERVLSLPNFEIGIVDDRSFIVPLGLKKNNKNYLNPKSVEEAKEALDAVKPYFKDWTLTEDASIDDKLRSNQIQVAFTFSGWTNCLFICDNPLNSAKVVPLNKSHLWVDLMAINKFSTKKSIAYDFINFIMEEKNQLANISEIGDFSILKSAYASAKNDNLISSNVEILQALESDKIDYELVSSNNFKEVKKFYDEARA